jgi:hypothetical protein
MHNPNNSKGLNLNVPERMAIIETTSKDLPVLTNAATSVACLVWHHAPSHVKATFHNLYPEAAQFLEAADKVLTNSPIAATVPNGTYHEFSEGCLNIALLGLLFMPADWTQQVLDAHPILNEPLSTFRKGYEELIATDKEKK